MHQDDVLLGFGIVLALIGVVLFARTKVKGDNSMELLGIKMQVSHPALFIFAAGVVLMLVPRLLPNGSPPPAAALGDATDAVAEGEAGAAEDPPGADGSEPGEPAGDCDADLPRRIEVANYDQFLGGLGRVLDRGCEGQTYVVENQELDLGYALQLRERFQEEGQSCRAFGDPELSDAPREYACQISGRWQVIEGEPFSDEDPAAADPAEGEEDWGEDGLDAP
ncbi:MAG: hypothetical protein PVI30_24530 [Myxococcales bacterium]|jgi:hypothetical protein